MTTTIAMYPMLGVGQVPASAAQMAPATTALGRVPPEERDARTLRESVSSREMSIDPAVVNVDCDDEGGHFAIRLNTIFAKRYRLIRLLGQGTFGKVVHAIDLRTQSHVAIKIIKAVQKYRDAAKVEIKVLRRMAVADPENRKRCIQLKKCFDYRHHVCLGMCICVCAVCPSPHY
jgi:dual-specificity kinase